MEKFFIKKDKYTKARGGTSKFLSIYCGNCNNEILLYQKDGPGNLLRMYLDKITAPPDYVKELSKINNKKDLKSLACSKCNTLLAVPMIYEPENRLALRVVGPIKKAENASGFYPLGLKENRTLNKKT